VHLRRRNKDDGNGGKTAARGGLELEVISVKSMAGAGDAGRSSRAGIWPPPYTSMHGRLRVQVRGGAVAPGARARLRPALPSRTG
jgi:hypothetical protein